MGKIGIESNEMYNINDNCKTFSGRNCCLLFFFLFFLVLGETISRYMEIYLFCVEIYLFKKLSLCD